MRTAARLVLIAILASSLMLGCRSRGGTIAGYISAISFSAAATIYGSADPDQRDDTKVALPAAGLLVVSTYALLYAAIFEATYRDDEATEASGAMVSNGYDVTDDNGSYDSGSYDSGSYGAGGSDGTAGQSGTPAASPRWFGGILGGAVDTSCSFGDCRTNGASGRTASGASVDTRCSFGDCSKNGWTTTGPDGSSDTRCSFGDCATNGWTTTASDGSSSDTRCSFGDCSKNGWTTTTPAGTSDTRCNFGNCNTDGWTTTNPDGSTTTCRCKFGDCSANGVDCN